MKNAEEQIVNMASNGLRTLCLAYQTYDVSRDWEKDQPMTGLILQIIVGIKDPVRKEVPAVIRMNELRFFKYKKRTNLF